MKTMGNNAQAKSSGNSEIRLRSFSQSRKAACSTIRTEQKTSSGRPGFANRHRTAQVSGIVGSTYLFSSGGWSNCIACEAILMLRAHLSHYKPGQLLELSPAD